MGPEFVIASQDILYFTGAFHSVRRGGDNVVPGVMDGLQNLVDTFALRPVTDETEQYVLTLSVLSSWTDAVLCKIDAGLVGFSRSTISVAEFSECLQRGD